MNERIYALTGILGIFVAYASIFVSILLSPWFSWQRNALSDLGHSVNSEVAPLFNLGLLFSGFLILIYSVLVLRKYMRYTSVCLVSSSLALQLVATFDEVYGFIHFLVSVLFFVSIGITSLVITIENRSLLALAAFIICSGSWISYGMQLYNAGISVPEILSFSPVAVLLVHSALKTYLRRE